MKYFFLSLVLMTSLFKAQGRDSTAIAQERYAMLIDSINHSFTWQHGEIQLGDGVATLDVPSGYKYLDPAQSKTVLTDLWGNPPAETYGLLFHENDNPLDSTISFVIEISYTEDGYVKDNDADKIDYDDLLADMKESIKENNPVRKEQGYPTMELIGWAAPPYYDKEQKKLHWAKELLFEDSPESTLNYDVRILGRRGFLVLTAIGSMQDLGDFNKDSERIIASTNFNKGHRYEDFDASIDKIAAYGIGGLIAGKLLLKAGLLAKVGILLAKFWKVIAVAFVALGARIRKIFSGGGDA